MICLSSCLILLSSSGLGPFNPIPMLQPTPHLGTSQCLAYRDWKGSRSAAQGLSTKSVSQVCWAKSNLVLHTGTRMPGWPGSMPQPYGLIIEMGKLGLCLLHSRIHHKLRMNIYHLSACVLTIINKCMSSTYSLLGIVSGAEKQNKRLSLAL